MSQNSRSIHTVVFTSLVISLGAFGFIAAWATPQAVKAAPKGQRAVKPSVGDPVAAFQMIIPAELEKQVTIKPSWLHLSEQMTALQDDTKVPVSLTHSVPNDPMFIAAPTRTEFFVLHQIRLLLTDDQWRTQWDTKVLDQEHRSYHLWREAISPQEQRGRMAQVAKARLAELLALLQAGPSAWGALRKDDPDMSNDIRQPILQAPLLLASQLSPEQLNNVLMGQTLSTPMADLSPENQSLVRQSFGHIQIKNLTGTKIVFTSVPLGSGKLGLSMSTSFASSPDPSIRDFSVGGFEMLYMDDPDFVPDEKARVESRHRQEAADALAAKTPGAKTVTIDKDAKPQEGEPPLAAYLRAFAEQTKLTVLAHWPSDSKALTDSKGQPKGLPVSIVNRPAGEALDLLCKTYGGEWVQDEATVRLRALPVPEPLFRKPAVTKPAPGGSPGR